MKRYDMGFFNGAPAMFEQPEGGYVKWSDVHQAAVQPADTLCKRLQQQCSDWGTYWRAPDAHGVVLSIEQASELLQEALGVEVEIPAPGSADNDSPKPNEKETPAQPQPAGVPQQARGEEKHSDHLTSDAVVCAATRALPHPGSPEASAMLDSLLAEYNYPANPKNAARAGWEAANRWLAPGPADTDRARSDEKESVAALPVQQWQPISTAPKDGSPVFLWLPELHGWREGPWRGSWSITEKQWTVHAPFAIGDKAVQFTALPAPTHWSALPPPPVDQGEQQ